MATTKKSKTKKTTTKNKTLIVYYSRTGFTKKVAESLSEELDSDLEVLNFKEGKRKGPVAWLKCGKEATKKETPEIESPKFDSKKYDRIILATPIWSSKISSPLRTYIKENLKLKSKAQLDIICTQGFSGAEVAIRDLKEENIHPKNILILKTKDIKQENYKERLDYFKKEKQAR